MDINNYFSNFKLPEFQEVTEADVLAEWNEISSKHPEFPKPEGADIEQWKRDIAVTRFVNAIIDKIHDETGIFYDNL